MAAVQGFLTICHLSSVVPLLEQVVYLLAGCFERGGRIRSIQINGIKGGSRNPNDVAGVIRDRE